MMKFLFIGVVVLVLCVAGVRAEDIPDDLPGGGDGPAEPTQVDVPNSFQPLALVMDVVSFISLWVLIGGLAAVGAMLAVKLIRGLGGVGAGVFSFGAGSMYEPSETHWEGGVQYARCPLCKGQCSVSEIRNYGMCNDCVE